MGPKVSKKMPSDGDIEVKEFSWRRMLVLAFSTKRVRKRLRLSQVKRLRKRESTPHLLDRCYVASEHPAAAATG